MVKSKINVSKLIVLIGVVAAMFSLLFAPCVLADEEDSSELGISQEDIDVSEFKEAWNETMKKASNIFLVIAAPFAAVSVAIGAFKLLTGTDEKASAKGLQQIIWSLAALAAVFFISLFVQLGLEAGEKYKWDPANPSDHIEYELPDSEEDTP